MLHNWIRIRTDLSHRQKVRKIAAITRQPLSKVIGGLILFWSYAYSNTTDGHIRDATIKDVDTVTGMKGFGDALVSVRWLTQTKVGLQLPKWKRWFCRQTSTVRVREHRERLNETQQSRAEHSKAEQSRGMGAAPRTYRTPIIGRGGKRCQDVDTMTQRISDSLKRGSSNGSQTISSSNGQAHTPHDGDSSSRNKLTPSRNGRKSSSVAA